MMDRRLKRVSRFLGAFLLVLVIGLNLVGTIFIGGMGDCGPPNIPDRSEYNTPVDPSEVLTPVGDPRDCAPM